MNQSMNDEAVYRTALATPGLLKMSSQSNTKTINLLVRKKSVQQTFTWSN